ncbi:hypothetical protein [Enterococcus sp. AZ194]|uniref:hypothetical protein n=1 Tax=Enterococcus sp. AZ194 TaxID=2774629 RepID=UPI003F683134
MPLNFLNYTIGAFDFLVVKGIEKNQKSAKEFCSYYNILQKRLLVWRITIKMEEYALKKVGNHSDG